MIQFPAVDPIPLPAPVWLFKLLHIVTLILHFTAVQLLIGGLTMATVWNFFGKKDSATRAASDSILRKLPTVMTYVINFGVPPLLFAQVLYGRALYTSSVLIGFYWFSVILVLTLTYFLLYRSVDRADNGRAWWGYAIASWAGVIFIAKIFSMNMTLMLRPEDWQAVYQASGGLGAIFPTGDPTTTPRFLFMLAGGLGLAGTGMLLLSAFDKAAAGAADLLRRWGGTLAIVFFALQIAAGVWVFRTQPGPVQTGLFADPMYYWSIMAWALFAIVTIVASAAAAFMGAARGKAASALPVLCGVLATASFVIVRDGIRDLSLLAHGFNVWQRTVVSNWSVVLLFLGLFVGGLILIGFVLVAVSRSAKKLAAAGMPAGGVDIPMMKNTEGSDDQ